MDAHYAPTIITNILTTKAKDIFQFIRIDDHPLLVMQRKTIQQQQHNSATKDFIDPAIKWAKQERRNRVDPAIYSIGIIFFFICFVLIFSRHI